jgi:hypothetical protein
LFGFSPRPQASAGALSTLSALDVKVNHQTGLKQPKHRGFNQQKCGFNYQKREFYWQKMWFLAIKHMDSIIKTCGVHHQICGFNHPKVEFDNRTNHQI